MGETFDQGDDSTTGCLFDYPYIKENYKMIAIDLSKQQSLDAGQLRKPKIVNIFFK